MAGGQMIQLDSANLIEGIGIEGDRYAQKIGFWQKMEKTEKAFVE